MGDELRVIADTIADGWPIGALKVRAAAETLERQHDALSELYALVKGECPSLLNEDSGGDAQLDLKIRELLNRP